MGGGGEGITVRNTASRMVNSKKVRTIFLLQSRVAQFSAERARTVTSCQLL